MMGESWWVKFPYASVFAMLIMLAGVGCFSGPLFIAISELEKLLNRRDTFNVHTEVLWMKELRILLTITAVVMGVYSIILAVFGFLATGATRKNVFSGAKCILGGRCSAVFFMILTYTFNLLWMAVTSAMAIPVLFFVMMKSICDTEYTYQGYQPGNTGLNLHCFNLTRFALYFPAYSKEFPDQFWHGPAICELSKLTDMCSTVNKEIPLFSAAFAGSFLIVVSLVTFIVILSINYQKIKTAKELTDYRDAIEQDTTEMDHIISTKRPFNSSYATESVLST